MIVVRFAPSPTGYLHLGSARTALFNWLFARRTGGKFILRIEDTDLERSDEKFLDEILEDLRWMGLDWDGDPVFQSRRFGVYRQKAETLLAAGKAYKDGEAIIYKVEKGKEIAVDDLIHGRITFNTDEIKDQVMIKSDGSPAYNFCCVVDDADLGITHIIRGDDHISNIPKQVLFYEALGASLPAFGHLPLMMGTDGAKLSKRHGGVSVEEYKREGFLPGAMANYLMLLGWHPADDKEIVPLPEAVSKFDIKDMNDTQVKFDIQKLRWMNGEYIMSSGTDDLARLLRERITSAGLDLSVMTEEKFVKLVELYKVRMKTLGEFPSLVRCFFSDDFEVEEKGKRKYLDKEGNRENIGIFAGELEKLEDFTHDNIENICRKIAEERELKAAQIIHPTRMAISGSTAGAGLFEMMGLLGREKVVERMKKAVAEVR